MPPGTLSFSNVSLAGLDAGTYTLGARFDGDSNSDPSSGTISWWPNPT